jgi:hypothetical protein
MKRERAGTTSCGGDTRRAPLVAVAVTLLALCAPAMAFAGPAIDEYSLNLPDAKGKVESPESSPTFNPATLSPDVTARLTRNPEGKALAVIATAGELGAPGSPSAGSGRSGVEGDQPSTLNALGGAVGDPAVIGLILLVGLAGGALFLLRVREPRGG